MKLINNIVYTVYSPYYEAWIESTFIFSYKRKLTHVGAKRILNRETGFKDAVVQRVETFIYT